MPYDESVANRVRAALLRAGISAAETVEEKKMFGGIAILVNGHMTIGVQKDEIIVRVRDDATALAIPHARPMTFTGRAMPNFVYVAKAGFSKEGDLDKWVARGLDFARSTPKKAPKQKRAASKTVVKSAAKKPATKGARKTEQS